MSTIASRTFTQAATDSRAHLNDAGADIFTDAVLLPFQAQVHAEIQDAFAAHGIPLVETIVSTLSYTADSDTISLAAVTDVQYPLELWEKDTGGSAWNQMKRGPRVGPPLTAAAATLQYWEWLNGAIRVERCSATRDVFMRYRRQLAYPTSGGGVDFDGIYWPLVFGTAYRAAGATGRDQMAASLGPVFYKRLEDSVHIASRDRQGIVYRQQPWGRASGRRRFTETTS